MPDTSTTSKSSTASKAPVAFGVAHKNAAECHEKAAKQHHEAAKLHADGNHEKADHCAKQAQEHGEQAMAHAGTCGNGKSDAKKN